MKKFEIEIHSEMDEELEYQVEGFEVMLPNDADEDGIENGDYDDIIFKQVKDEIDFEPYEIYVVS